MISVTHAMRLAGILCLSFVATLAWFSGATRCEAAELTWQAPADCPDGDAVRWRIEEALNTGLQSAAPLRFSAEVEKRANGRFRVVIIVSGGSAESEPQRREIEAATCDELVKAASVAIALALGAGAAREGHGSTAVASACPKPFINRRLLRNG